MSEVRDQLILYLQQLIDKRLTDKKTTNVSNLFGDISQFKEFREWLKNNFRNDSKTNLLEFIQKEIQHFQYDFETGFIVNNNRFDCNPSPDLTPIVLKPKLFSDLETDHSMDRFDDNLFVLELIISIIKEVNTQSISVSVLMESIGQKCENQFNCFKSMVKTKDRESDVNYIDQKRLIDLMTNHLKPIFSYDYLQNTFTLNTDVLKLSELMDCLTKTSLIVVKNCLIRYLYRFGQKYSNEMNNWFVNKHRIAFEFMANQRLSLDQIIDKYSDEFVVKVVKRKTRIVDLNPRLIGESRSHEFELMYKYGTEIRGGIGVITRVTDSCATIESQVEFVINGQILRPEFKAICELVHIYGQEISDLRTFVHLEDRLSFDVKFFTTFKDVDDVWSQNCSYDLWFVSRIHSIRHSADCFINSILVDLKYGQWNTICSSSDTSDSDDSSYERREDEGHTSDSP